MNRTWGGWRRAGLPADVKERLAAEVDDRALAWALDERTGAWIVAGECGVYAVPTDTSELTLAKAWHLVDSGVFDRDSSTLTLTWVDQTPRNRFTFVETNGFPETLRERVQASVVIAEIVDLGDRRTARIVIRRDLASGDLLSQTILGKGVRSSDPGVMERSRVVMAQLREQVGLD